MDLSDLVIPTSVTQIINSFNCDYGKGTFDWDKTFDKNSTYNNLSEIVNSFRIGNFVGNEGVEFVIHDMMFANMPALRAIGYDYSNPGKRYYNGAISSVDYYGTRAFDHNSANYSFNVGFSGNGYNKKFKDGKFPKNILKNVGINSGSSKISQINTFCGLFSYLDSNVLTDPNETFIEFPGDMFITNSEEALKLEDISALFMNSRVPIKLTSEGFRNCPYLFNVTRLFYIN
jgi:hypothetical protein